MSSLVFRLHTASLLALGIACFACRVPVPQPPQLTIALKAKGRLQAPPPPKVVVHAEVEVGAEVPTYVEAEVIQPTVPVALEGALVVEFFGIPLEGTQDIVFVLDRSGSMDELALGQIAALVGPPVDAPPAPPVDAPPAPPVDAPPAPPVDAPLGPPVGAPLGPPVGAPPAPPDDSLPVQPVEDPASPEGQVPAPEAGPLAVPPPPQRPRKIDVAHAELVDALRRLPAGIRMNVLFFNNRLEAHQAGIVAMAEGDREDLIAFVRGTFPDGTTALAPAMRTAFLMNAKRIVLLSDGLGNVGGDAAAVLRDAREAMRGGVRIDTIGLGQDQDSWLLRRLAEESGGIYQAL